MPTATNPVEYETPLFSDGFEAVEVRSDGWYARIEISWRFPHCPPEHDVVDLGFLAVDPNAFVFRIRIVEPGSFVGEEPARWADLECLRLLDLLRNDGEVEDLRLRGASGYPSSVAGWVEKDAPVSGDCPLEIPADLAFTNDAGSTRLAESIRSRYSGTGRHLEHNLQNFLFVTPFLRSKALALARSRPWLLAETSAFDMFDLVLATPDEASPSDPVRSVERAVTPEPDLKAADAAVACVARFGGVPRGLGVKAKEIDIYRLLASLPVDWHPRSREDLETAAVFSGIAGSKWTFGENDLRLLMSGLKGRWTAFARSVVVDGGGGEVPLEAYLHGIGDMLDHVAEHLVHPVVRGSSDYVSEEARRTARRLVSVDGGLGLLARRSAKWHQRWWELPVLERRTFKPWRKLTEDFTDGTRTLVFLATPEALVEESRRMGHCVGGMSNQCARGYGNVASVSVLRDGRRMPSSTVEVRYGNDPSLSVRQHRGPHNGDPTHEDVAFVAAWLEEAISGRMPTDRTPVISSRKPGGASVLGLPPTGTPADWKGILSPRYAAMDWYGLMAEIRDLNRAMRALSERSKPPRRTAAVVHKPSGPADDDDFGFIEP